LMLAEYTGTISVVSPLCLILNCAAAHEDYVVTSIICRILEKS
jgi:hypothetical protein